MRNPFSLILVAILLVLTVAASCEKAERWEEAPTGYSGVWIYHEPSGEKEEVTFDNGLRIGPYKKWDANGNLVEEGGYGSSSPISWYPHGRIRKWNAVGELVADKVWEEGSLIQTLYPPKPKPLCKPFSKFTIRGTDLNRGISSCDLYFYVDAVINTDYEKYVRVIVCRGKPVELGDDGKPTLPRDQLIPYHYKWMILDENGKEIRSWLAYFIKNRDGTYHTVVKQPPNDWEKSVLEVYFEDVNGDGVREDVKYHLMLGDILLRQKDTLR